jgi:twitching motility protein PilT
MMDINEFLKTMVDSGASDLHLQVASPPVMRIDGNLKPLDNTAVLTAADLESIFTQVITPDRKAIFQQELDLDCAYDVPGLSRFRVNILKQRGTLCMAFRIVPLKIPSVDDIGLPPVCKTLILKPRGLILITGPTGSGKSTTLAALVNYLNENAARTVITIEDPIEYLYRNQKCLIAQRDLGDDTHSFARALKGALRHDPQVLVIGELRDLETIAIAITAAETGHLVLGTLHTNDAVQAVQRIVDVFPQEQQNQIRIQLAEVMEAVIAQRLLPRIGGGRVAAFEILLNNSSIKGMILSKRLSEIPANMDMSRLDGMQTIDKALAKLVHAQVVTTEDALARCTNIHFFEKCLEACRE